MMTTKERLIAARDLVAKGWTQGVYARDANDRYTPYGGPNACKFCASGAVAHVTDIFLQSFEDALTLLKRAIDGKAVVPWNDASERTQAEVVAAFDRAIELAS